MFVCVVDFGLIIYLQYDLNNQRKKLSPACEIVGGQVVKLYDGEWVCLKSTKLEK